MMLVALLAVSFVTCSLAQTECDVATQTLFTNSDCTTALGVVFDGVNSSNGTNATAVEMVCGGSSTCSQNIASYLDYCPVSIAANLPAYRLDQNTYVRVSRRWPGYFQCHGMHVINLRESGRGKIW